MLEKINISADQFLSSFFEPTENVCFRVFDDKGGTTFKGQKLECVLSKYGTIEETLLRHNAQNRGIFFVVNSGGQKDEEITRINAQFVESDEGTFDEQWERISAFPLPPSLVVKTQKSLHCYWLIKSGKVEKFRHIQKQLVAQFNGDPACVNESRVLRLPGFNHCKKSPIPVECVLYHPERRYTQNELSELLPKIAEEKTAAVSAPSATRKGLAQVGKRCDFMQHCKANAATLPENQWYSMITNLAVFEGGEKAIHALSKPYPKYNYADTQSKIAHFLNSGTKPITCAKIAEYGFKCPKFENKQCDCKSPAALAFKPLTTAELLEILNKLEIPDSALEKIEKIKGFISEYLYNIEPVIAETILSHNVKDIFGLKASEMTPLIKNHREIYKRYADSKETKRETSGFEFPAWYEVTEKGAVRFMPGVLAEDMAKNENVFYTAEQYYVYENGVYNAISDLAAKAIVRRRMIARYTGLSNITDAEGQWRMLIMKPLREINSNPYIINVRNGLFNVLDGSFSEHSPKYCSTVQLNVKYTPDAQCQRFIQFLHEALDDTEIPLIQEMLGYFLIPVNKAQKSFVIVGEPGAGKSKLLLTLNEVLLGQENVSNIAWQSLNERFKTAELFGKLANIFADLPTKNIDDNGVFKALVGEDYLTAERKNKDPFTFQPYTRLLFSCNSIPRNYGDKSEGFYRRLIIIRFSKPVPEKQRDAELLDKFKAESDGIFMFAVEGLRRLIANKFKFSETEKTRTELQRYRVDSNSVLSFIEDNCTVSPDFEIERNELFERYKDYCKAAGLSAMSQKSFNKDLELANPNIKRSVDKLGKRRTWKGIKIDTEI
jgi:putative DNA primase/helicase